MIVKMICAQRIWIVFNTVLLEMKFVLKDITNFTSRVLSDGKHLRFDIPLNKGNLQALYFNCSKEIEQLQQKKTISLIGTLKINKYLNTESINMIIEDMK